MMMMTMMMMMTTTTITMQRGKSLRTRNLRRVSGHPRAAAVTVVNQTPRLKSEYNYTNTHACALSYTRTHAHTLTHNHVRSTMHSCTMHASTHARTCTHFLHQMPCPAHFKQLLSNHPSFLVCICVQTTRHAALCRLYFHVSVRFLAGSSRQ